MGARPAGVAWLPYGVFGVFDDVKRYDVRMDISYDGSGTCSDDPETYRGYVRWNDDYCSVAVCHSLTVTLL